MGDLISRQVAIDAMAELQGRAYTKAELKGISKIWKRITQLPSAQPEIIRCKDCKFLEKHTVTCANEKSCVFSTREDFGCVFAERK